MLLSAISNFSSVISLDEFSLSLVCSVFESCFVSSFPQLVAMDARRVDAVVVAKILSDFFIV